MDLKEEDALVQMCAGIIPVHIFYSKISKGLDPFEGLSDSNSKKLKRKWRKLKRKYEVKNVKLSSAAFKIRNRLNKDFQNEKA